ncbi:glycosyltransferase [Bradyrhizobium iriomotense]|uniref:glycosyltransferase n=1 Tax=Bradyrhizobium iriomotense TaxID=441950 RepID=UPI0024E11B57|nr:glycosyltransferase [Bradyrhizobium iriomotense]
MSQQYFKQVMARRRKILFVAMHHSPHTARWIDIAADLGYDMHFFPLDSGDPHEKLRNVTLHLPVLNEQESTVGMRRRAGSLIERAITFFRLIGTNPICASRHLKRAFKRAILRRGSDQSSKKNEVHPAAGVIRQEFFVGDLLTTPNEAVRLGRADESDATTEGRYGPQVLAALIARLQPDLIHSMEFQHAAYLVLAARDVMPKRFPRWLATNWGSDIFYFGNFPDHARQIRRVCQAIDRYSCECHRDLALGRQFGYSGPDMPVLPNSGGMDIEHVRSLRDSLPPSKRKMIMVKGYDHFAGRAMISLALLERFAEQLREYTIVLYSVGARPRVRALELADAGILNIKVIDLASHDDILRHFGKARIYLGISISDAISTSVLEAMAMGAFPIQTNTSCCEEWFVNSMTGFAVPPDDFEEICGKFERALKDDALVDYAAIENFKVIESRLGRDTLKPKMAEFYRRALA